VILLADGGEGQAWLAERVPSLAGMKPVDGKAALYRCENFTCSAPEVDPQEIKMWNSGRQEGLN
jgi:hypothetical protein